MNENSTTVKLVNKGKEVSIDKYRGNLISREKLAFACEEKIRNIYLGNPVALVAVA